MHLPAALAIVLWKKVGQDVVGTLAKMNIKDFQDESKRHSHPHYSRT